MLTRGRPTVVNAAVAALLTIVFGGVSLTPPQNWGELDSSWVLGLDWWFEHRSGGSAVIFTYGPLGWLTEALVYARTEATLALLFTFLMTAALAFLVIVGLRPFLGWVGAVVAAALALSVTTPAAETLGTATVLGALLVIRAGHSHRRLPALLGAWGAFVVLIKPGTGLTCLAVAAAMSLRESDRLRQLATTALAAILTLVLGWLAVGQSITQLAPWVYGSTQLFSGYWVMMVEDPTLHSQYWAMLALTLVFVVTVLPQRASRGVQLAVFLPFAFFTFKHGFVSHGRQGSSAIASMAVVAIGCLPAPKLRSRVSTAWMAAAAVVWLTVTVNHIPWSQLKPTSTGTDTLARSVRQAFWSPSWRKAHAANVAYIRAATRLTPAMATQLVGGTQVDSWATWALWPQTAGWQPVPTFQQYSAYTSWLDRHNAAAINGRHAPGTVLRALNQEIAGRFALFDPPAYQLAVVCHYAEASSDPVWQVLHRTPASRCGAETKLGSAKVREGVAVPVPAPHNLGDLVVARMATSLPAWYRLRTILYKPAALPAIRLDGVAYGLVLPTLDDGMIMHLPTTAPSLLGGHAGIDPHAFTLLNEPVSGTVTFYEITYQ